MEPRGAVFIYIPKAAGVTVDSFLRKHYPRERQFWFTLKSWKTYQDSDDIRYVHGHFDFERAHSFRRDRAIVTFLRDPIARTLSEYYYWKSFTDEFIAKENLREARLVRPMRVRNFLSSSEPSLRLKSNNFLTKTLAGFKKLNRVGEVDEQVYQRALANLETVDFVGIVERMDASMKAMLEVLGIDDRYQGERKNVLASLPENEGFRRISPEPLTTEECEMLLEGHRFDIRLYRHAFERFEEGCRRSNP
jgi:hypothetical protein